MARTSCHIYICIDAAWNTGKLPPVYLLSVAGGDQNMSIKNSTKIPQLAKIWCQNWCWLMLRIPGLVPNVLCFLDLNLCCIVFCEWSHFVNLVSSLSCPRLVSPVCVLPSVPSVQSIMSVYECQVRHRSLCLSLHRLWKTDVTFNCKLFVKNKGIQATYNMNNCHNCVARKRLSSQINIWISVKLLIQTEFLLNQHKFLTVQFCCPERKIYLKANFTACFIFSSLIRLSRWLLHRWSFVYSTQCHLACKMSRGRISISQSTFNQLNQENFAAAAGK